MVLDLIGGEKSEALHGIEGIEADGGATITETMTEECEQNVKLYLLSVNHMQCY